MIHLLSEGIVFQQNQTEPSLWLAALPTALHSSKNSTELPDDVALTDEAATVIGFLDDCLQRCLKTPYRYIEEMQSLHTEAQPDDMPSPLIMAVLEHLGAKVASKQASSSDLFALATFLRKLMLRLSTAQHDLSFLRHVAGKIDGILSPDALSKQGAVVSSAIRREMKMMHNCLPQTHVRRDLELGHGGLSKLEEFLRQIGDRPIRMSRILARCAILTTFQLTIGSRVWQPPLKLLTGFD